LSRDYGWTPREILELTPSEVLIYVERTGAKRVFVSTREAREIATAARERRTAWIDRELTGARGDDCEVDTRADWERLVCWSERIVEESPGESDAMSGEVRGFEVSTTRDGERLRQIYDELRMIRAAVTADKRAW